MITKTQRPATWIWQEYRQDGATQTVMEDDRGAAFTRRILADIGEQTYAALKEHFFACPPEIPLDEFKATLRFLRFLTTLTDEERWETSGEQTLDASAYSLD